MQQDEKKKEETGGANPSTFERTGSNDHNDYRIEGDEKKEERDEKESYSDYNGNSEANNPARAK